jgi:hypothetical protein
MATLQTTPALKRAYASAPGGADIWPTLELSHSAFAQTYYLTSASQAFSAQLESGVTVTFQPFPFAITLPAVDGAGQQDLTVSLTNADPFIMREVQAAHVKPTERIVAVYREFLATVDGSAGPQSAPLRLSFATLQITEDAVTGIAGRSDTLNRRFPGVWYDIAHFPGLDR